jgi:peptidoglycan/LPS O-acetylase OafA/YrhL
MAISARHRYRAPRSDIVPWATRQTSPTDHLSGGGAPVQPATHYPLGYNPAFDGLRAVAVLSVVFLHFDVPGFSGGAIGVDVFFVLSGYLITALLMLSIGRGQPLGVFYWQRFLRLAPPLVLLCATLLAIAPLFGMSSQIIADSLASLLYVSDWTEAFHAEGIPMFLGNTWSLAIEEQFYLVWPLLLLAMLRTRGRGFALAGSLGLLVISLLWQRWMIARGADFDRIYDGFDTRCFGLLIGCTVALAHEHLVRVRRLLRAAGLAGAACFVAAVASAPWTPLTSIGVSLGAGMVIADLAAHRDGPIQYALSLRAPVAIGRISYAIYLWHYPIMLVIGRNFALPKVAGILLGIGLTVLCATVSFFIVEQPARRLRGALSLRWAARAGRSAALFSFTGLFIGVGVFWQADIANLIHPKPIEIVGYGPRSIRRGETFNVQPGGSSVMWISTSRSVPASVRIKVGPDLLETSARGTLTTAILPDAIRDRVGPAAVTIVSQTGDLLAGPVRFEVSP